MLDWIIILLQINQCLISIALILVCVHFQWICAHNPTFSPWMASHKTLIQTHRIPQENVHQRLRSHSHSLASCIKLHLVWACCWRCVHVINTSNTQQQCTLSGKPNSAWRIVQTRTPLRICSWECCCWGGKIFHWQTFSAWHGNACNYQSTGNAFPPQANART